MKAIINATPAQKIERNIGRIKRLREALAKPNLSSERATSLNNELVRRLTEAEELKKALENL